MLVSWTPTIFVTRGFDVTYSVAMSVVMNLGIPLGVFVLSQLVDRFGRKPQLIILMPLSGILGLAWSFVPADQTALIMALGFIMVAMVYYWSLICSSVYLSEPFPTEVKIRAAGFANAFGRIGAILNPIWVAYFLTTDLGAIGIFGVSLLTACIAAILVAIWGVETKGKTLEEINDVVFKETNN